MGPLLIPFPYTLPPRVSCRGDDRDRRRSSAQLATWELRTSCHSRRSVRWQLRPNRDRGMPCPLAGLAGGKLPQRHDRPSCRHIFATTAGSHKSRAVLPSTLEGMHRRLPGAIRGALVPPRLLIPPRST